MIADRMGKTFSVCRALKRRKRWKTSVILRKGSTKARYIAPNVISCSQKSCRQGSDTVLVVEGGLCVKSKYTVQKQFKGIWTDICETDFVLVARLVAREAWCGKRGYAIRIIDEEGCVWEDEQEKGKNPWA
jgi:hypothetical protein